MDIATTPEESRPAFAVVIPCYNEEHGIREAVAGVTQAVADGVAWELVVVNDGSDDGTAGVLAELSSSYPHLRVAHHGRNRGYGAAIKTGVRRTTAPFIVITDADGTYPSERIPDLLELAEDADMVVGARTGPDVTYPFLRRIPKFFLARYAAWITGSAIPDMNSGLRVMRREVLDRFLNILPSGFSFTTTITLAMHTNSYRVTYVPISYASRVGKSKIRPIRDTIRFLQLIVRTGMYFAPLRIFFPIAVTLGLAFVASLAYDLFVLHDLTDKTLLLLLSCLNTGMFALLADMLDKRTPG